MGRPLVEPSAPAPDEGGDLVPVHDISGAEARTMTATSVRPEILEQGPQGGDADPAPMRTTRSVDTGVVGERPVGTLDGHPGARPSRRTARLWSPSALTVTRIRGSGEGGERVRVRLPPQVPGQETPLEELASRHGQAVEAAAPADDREHARGFLADLDDPQLVADVAPDRLARPGRR